MIKWFKRSPLSSYHYNKGNKLFDKGRYEEAILEYDKQIALSADIHGIGTWPSWNEKGKALVMIGKHKEALDCFDTAIKKMPEFYQAWINKGNLLFWELNEKTKALQTIEEGIKNMPDLRKIPLAAILWFFKVGMLFELGRYDEIITFCDHLISTGEGGKPILKFKGYALEAKGKKKEAKDCFGLAGNNKINYNYEYLEKFKLFN